jgi:hypothetical protein
MLIGERPTSFQFHDQLIAHKKIGRECSKQCAVFIEDIEGMLLKDLETLLPQSVKEAILVNFFDVAVAEVAVQRETGFTDLVGKLEDRVFHTPFFAPSAPFCG